ncbi:cardiolipin synthase [Rhodnius prolixus]|uniref:cardiolipin synthase (CMP-forming) n=1 Tax=Rhodnius prolixus TaxID=13249 RepID=R4FJU5_RHOPR
MSTWSIRHLLPPTAFYWNCHPILRIRQRAFLRYPAPIFALCQNGVPNGLLSRKWLAPPVYLFPINSRHEQISARNVGIRENICTVPNILCVTRILATPYLGYLILSGDHHLAFYILLWAGVSDLLDGFIARTWREQSSTLGSLLDPLADKILIVTLFTAMSCSNLIPGSLTALIIARDMTLAGAAFFIRYKSLPAPKTLQRYMDLTLATVQLQPTNISKVNTAVQLATLALTLTASAFNFIEHPVLICSWSLTAATTIASAVSYLVSKNTYKILKSPPASSSKLK